MKPIHPALAIFPRKGPEHSMDTIVSVGADGEYPLDTSKAQITPQNFAKWTPEQTRAFADRYPNTTFRFHASVRLGNYEYEKPREAWFDLAGFVRQPRLARAYFEALGECNAALGSPLYSFHTGRKVGSGSIQQLKRAFNEIQSIMQCECAIETLYPLKARPGYHWVESWREHEELLASGVPFVLDMSHLNIIAHSEGHNLTLVEAMLAAPQLKEIHISGNDGTADAHESLASTTGAWWWPLVEAYEGPADIFSEGCMKA